MDALYVFWDSSTHYKTEIVSFLGRMNSATKMFSDPKGPSRFFL